MLNMPLSNIIMKECVINASVGAHMSDVFECRRESPSSMFALEFYLEKSNNMQDSMGTFLWRMN
jgi:hypothetical protein